MEQKDCYFKYHFNVLNNQRNLERYQNFRFFEIKKKRHHLTIFVETLNVVLSMFLGVNFYLIMELAFFPNEHIFNRGNYSLCKNSFYIQLSP